MSAPKLCLYCNKPVDESHDVFEQMHWLCFHLEFEHEGDPDKPCQEPSCPWLHLEIMREKLIKLGFDPQAVIEAGIAERAGIDSKKN